jgi:hypothetical protein
LASSLVSRFASVSDATIYASTDHSLEDGETGRGAEQWREHDKFPNLADNLTHWKITYGDYKWYWTGTGKQVGTGFGAGRKFLLTKWPGPEKKTWRVCGQQPARGVYSCGTNFSERRFNTDCQAAETPVQGLSNSKICPTIFQTRLIDRTCRFASHANQLTLRSALRLGSSFLSRARGRRACTRTGCTSAVSEDCMDAKKESITLVTIGDVMAFSSRA